MLGVASTTIRWKSLGFVSLAPALFGFYVIYDDTHVTMLHDPLPFVRRPWETEPEWRRLEYVIYADPECPACRKLARAEAQIERRDVVFHYRWYLLPPTSGRTLRAAIAIESASRQNPQAGVRLREAIFASDEKLTDATILKISEEVGLREVVYRALHGPTADVLRWIKDDGLNFENARYSAVPQPGMVIRGRFSPVGIKMIYNMADPNYLNPAEYPPEGENQ